MNPRLLASVRCRAGRAALVMAMVAGTFVALSATPSGAVVSSNVVPVLTRGTDSNGGQMPLGAGDARISSNGRWLAWNNANGNGTYRKDLLSGTTVLVSLNDADQPAASFSTIQGISTDGTKVAFITSSQNMGQGQATTKDIFVRDVPGKSTVRANIDISGWPIAAYGGHAALSDDGKVVAFNIISTGATIVRTLATGVSERVDLSSNEVAGNGQTDQVTLNSTGRFVAFASDATNLVPNDTNSNYDVFVRDRQAGTTERVSLGDGGQVSGQSVQPSISADGRYVAFLSLASDVVAGDTNNQSDVFRRDRTNLTTYRVSVSSANVQSNQGSYGPDVSDDGRFVTFGSSSTTLAPPLVAGSKVFRRDISQGLTTQVGLTPAGKAGNDNALAGSMSADGKTLALVSKATDLVEGDTNAYQDAFVDHTVAIGPFHDLPAFSNRQVTDFGAPNATKAARAADLTNGRTSPEHLVVSLAHSPAWALHRQPVARLYQAFFHREPDLNGLNYWVKKHSTGTKLSKIAAFFAGSSEFATAYGNVDNPDFVKLVYGNVLQRKPDAAGLAHWTAKLDGGMSRGDLMVAFSESHEGARVLAPEVDSALIGLGMLGAMPPKSLYEQAAAAHRSTGVPEGAAAVYIASTQYLAHVGP